LTSPSDHQTIGHTLLFVQW